MESTLKNKLKFKGTDFIPLIGYWNYMGRNGANLSIKNPAGVAKYALNSFILRVYHISAGAAICMGLEKIISN
jgi:hypothetical protein